MKSISKILLIAIVFTAFAYLGIVNVAAEEKQEIKPKVLVVWSSADKEVATNMVFMYVSNAPKFGWVDEIQLLIWGPSAKLLAEDTDLQNTLKIMKERGVILTACKACADGYKVSEKLTSLGVDVKYMGKALTDALASDWKVITF